MQSVESVLENTFKTLQKVVDVRGMGKEWIDELTSKVEEADATSAESRSQQYQRGKSRDQSVEVHLSRGGKIAAKSELNVGLQIRTKISGLSNLDVVTTQVSQPRMEESIGGRFEKKRSKKQEEEDQCRETDATCCYTLLDLKN